MKKTIIAAAAIVIGIGLFAANGSAADELRIWVNGRLLQSEIPARLEEGKTLAPARELAEMLGATVRWNGERNAVDIQMPQTDSLQRQIEQLQNALKAAAPEEAVENWARAVQTRNGAMEYAMLSKGLKETRRELLEKGGWVTGTSSPWLAKYSIGEKQANTDGSFTFRVKFDYRTSEDADKPERWNELDSFPVIVREENGSWYVSALPTEWATQSATLPDGRSFSEYDGAYAGKHIRVEFSRLGVSAEAPIQSAVGNHASVVETEEIELPVGRVTLAKVERTPPAAANSDKIAYEYWLVLVRSDPERTDSKRAYVLNGSVTGELAAAREELLDIAKTWRLLED